MHYKLVNKNPKTFVLVFETNDELAQGLHDFASKQTLASASFKAIGALSSVKLGWLNWETKQYEPSVSLDEQVELLSLIGDIALKDGEPSVHAHAAVGKRDGTAHGGHLLQARVRPTCEVVLTESPEHLKKEFDPTAGIALIKLKVLSASPTVPERMGRMTRNHQPDQADFRVILPEDINWQTFPAFPSGARLAILIGHPNEPAPYVIRVKVPGGVKMMPHKHPEDRIYTVMSGVFYIGLGETFDGDKVKAYPPGSVIVLPGETWHFHWAKSGEYVTQISAIGPLGLEYHDAADDPRRQHQHAARQ